MLTRRAAVLGALAEIAAVRGTFARKRRRRLGVATHDGHWSWDRGTLRVLDFTAPELDGYVAQKVAEWDAALPASLRLIYERREMRENCADVSKVTGRAVICSMRRDAGGAAQGSPAGVTYLWGSHGVLEATKTVLVANTLTDAYWGYPLGCHELGHALGLQHAPWYDEEDRLRSCMWAGSGTPDAPGPHDVEALARLY